MKVLTFVIPAYNSEKFLDKILGSMLLPQLLEKLEILVVNDGSSDATAAIAQDYSDRYPGTVCLISQQNRGHGGALNTGLAAARGKYVKVIDADDWVETENLPEFISLLEECSSDVVLTHHYTTDISTGEVKKWKSFPEHFQREYCFQEIMSSWKSFDRSLTFHGITYRREFYQKHAQPLCEHVFYEDHEYATFPCCYARSIQVFDLFLYNYRIGDVTQSVSMGNQLKRIGHTETVLQKMMERYKALPEGSGREYAAMKIQGLLLSYLTTALLVHPDKKAGRQLADAQMVRCAEGAPEAHALAKGKYQIFCILNRLHISKEVWDRLIGSELYRRIRKNHTFD